MKVVGSIRKCHETQVEANEPLKLKTDAIFGDNKNKEVRWHYESRLKSLESFTQKVETGRFDPNALEDFFACTIVVENIEAIGRAVKLVKKYCDILEKRPKSELSTSKPPESFRFDDLRLYVKLKQNPSLPSLPIHNVKFEIQIKTYLQHAWAIATHDLVYKANEISWGQQRIAYQIKASLEAAETAIAGAQDLAKIKGVAISSGEVDKLTNITDFLKKNWHSSALPYDIVRLSTVLLEFMEATGLNLEEIGGCLKAETSAGRGLKTLNLSPYLVIVQSLVYTRNSKLESYLTTADRRRFKVLIPSEISLPSGYPAPVPAHLVTT